MVVNLSPVSFTREKVPICSLSRRLARTQSLPGTLGEDKDLLPLPVYESRIVQTVV